MGDQTVDQPPTEPYSEIPRANQHGQAARGPCYLISVPGGEGGG